ncbi:MAG: 2,3-bisphosphoglycerate-independent phosphoglycerate mutase [Alphaproteobacteria bacterium]|nr:2,3-bisphosphoglycerate-independent phosphoglycerate mutase [Alphaproteobacteria bacterium]
MTTPLPALAKRPKPVVLAILDGWGCRHGGKDNAIEHANTPNWDYLSSHFPAGQLSASAFDVGLPDGQMGNSEVGHMNIGSGRVILQDLPRIDEALAQGSLKDSPEFIAFVKHLREKGTNLCHIMGLLSPGGVHSHDTHVAELAKLLAVEGVDVEIHAFLDGRDTPPRSALGYLKKLEEAIAPAGEKIRIVTVSGRYYAMDRDNRWDRVSKAYNVIVDGVGETAFTPAEAVEQSYAKGKSDEFVLPTAINGYAGIVNGDGLLMINFRADRARQLLSALLIPEFDQFPRHRVVNFSTQLGMIEYSSTLAKYIPALFPPEVIRDTLGETVSRAGLKQLRIAETEKYAHVTFFFNAGEEQVFEGESRILVPSPKVATYDLQPEMSAFEVAENIERVVANDEFDLIVVNFANPDMVGHTGNLEASIIAVQTVDTCLGRLKDAIFAKGGVLVISADHGNIEQLEDEATGQAHTAHTLSLVPFITAYQPWEGRTDALPLGKLSDIAPTLLSLLGLPQPAAMTGTSRLIGLLETQDA